MRQAGQANSTFNKPTEAPSPIFVAVSGAEGDMRKVYDLALIIHEFMIDRGPLSEEMRGALSHLTADLVTLGQRLCRHSDHLYEEARRHSH